MSGGGRVPISNTERKTIQNIKEITGNHSDDEIYAMLKDCAMDPNETAQKLLLQDPFHEVRRKRNRKKENLNEEYAEPRWKPGMQGRGNRGGRGNYSSRNISHDAGGGRYVLSAKENGINQGAEEGAIRPTAQDKKIKETSVVASSSSVVNDGTKQSEVIAATAGSKSERPMRQVPPTEASKSPAVVLEAGSTHGQLMSSSGSISASKTPSPSAEVYLSASDPILMPSRDSRLPVGTIRREVGSQQTSIEEFQETPVEIKSSASRPEVQGVGKSLVSETTRSPPSTRVSSSIGRPSSNHNNRSQQAIGPQKVGPSKEWKPKTPKSIIVQGPGTVDSIESPAIPVEAHTPLQPASSVLESTDAPSELERKLEESHISDSRHVIIPNHFHVPEAEKLGFCFGSFDADFGVNANSLNDPVNDKSLSLFEASEGINECTEEQPSRNQNALADADDGDYPEHPPSTCNVRENSSPVSDVSFSVAPEHSESKQETSHPTADHQHHQHPVVHTNPNFSFGFMPPMISSQLPPFESSESQVRDGSRVPSFVQAFDPASYHAQFYRSVADSDGRISPFHLPGVATKYNGNVAMLSPQASQSSQEVGNSLMSSAAGPTPIATQAAGVMQSSIAVTQQPLPVFRQPTGVHLSHYPPNYIPYGPYFSPFYIPPPAIHQFLSNGTFPQQPQAGSMYGAPPVATPKYPLPQYKAGSNIGNSAHTGMPGSYGPYGTSPAGYSLSSASTAGNSTSNEDLGGSQFKESNVNVTGQQGEGSGVCIAAPGRDLQGSSFYNLPHGGQVAYTPTQAGHGPFASIYHPPQPATTGSIHPLLQQIQTMAGGVDMVRPTASVYQQQPQPTQINWPNNY